MRFYLVTTADGVPVAAYLTPAQRIGAMVADPVPGAVTADVDAAPWAADGSESFGRTPVSMRRTAAYCLTDHGHAWRFVDAEDRRLTRENCGACVLSGYGYSDREIRVSGPNYAGWSRVYVEAGRPVPIAWTAPFWRELAGAGSVDPDGWTGSPNPAYGDALRRDVATFGLRFVTPDGRTVDGTEVRR